MTTSFSSVRPMTTAALSSGNSWPAKFEETTTSRAMPDASDFGATSWVIWVIWVGESRSWVGTVPSFMYGVVFSSVTGPRTSPA